MDIDLESGMNRLLSSEAYYFSVPPRDISYYSQTTRQDPDGKIRDMSSIEEIRLREKNLHYIDRAISELSGMNQSLLDLGAGHCTAGAFKSVSRYIAIDAFLPDSIISTDLNCLGSYDKSPLLIKADIETAVESFSTHICTSNVILIHHVIEHLTSPDVFLKKVAMHANPGSLFIVGTPDFASYAASIFNSNFRLLADPTHISLFSKDSLCRLLRDIGLQVLRIDTPYDPETMASSELSIKQFHNLAMEGKISPAFPGNIFTVYAIKTS